MKKVILILLFIAALIGYVLLYLGVEIELKSHVEAPDTNIDRLISSATRIRSNQCIQLILFTLLLAYSIYASFVNRKK